MLLVSYVVDALHFILNKFINLLIESWMTWIPTI